MAFKLDQVVEVLADSGSTFAGRKGKIVGKFDDGLWHVSLFSREAPLRCMGFGSICFFEHELARVF